MRNTSVRVVAALVLFLLPFQTAFASADEAKKVFDSLFAAKIKAVTATGDRSDDIALGKEMLAIAKTSEGQPELLALICDQVHDLCIKHADGFATAVEAQQLLADTVETKRTSAQEKLTTLLTRQMTIGKADEREGAGESLIALLISMGDEKFEKKQYAEAAGDYRRAVTVATQRKSASLEEAKAKLEFAAARDRAVKNLARLQEKLLKDANDFATAEEIVKLYVIELDDPAGAVPFSDRVKDEQLKAIVKWATMVKDDLSKDQVLALGEWYAGILRPPVNAAMSSRAEEYLTRFLEIHLESDLKRTKAEAILKSVRASAPKSPAIPERVINYVKFINVRTKLELGVDSGSKDENAKIIQYTQNDAPSHQWEVIAVPKSKAVRLRNRNSGRFLFVFDKGDHVLQRLEPSNEGSDLWVIEPVAGGIVIRSERTGNVLDVPDGKVEAGLHVFQWKANGGENQKWEIVKVKAGPGK